MRSEHLFPLYGTGGAPVNGKMKRREIQPAMSGQPQRVTIMGLGLFGGGLGAAEYFIRRGCRVTVTDLKTHQELQPSIEKLEALAAGACAQAGRPVTLHLGGHVESDFTDADLVVVSPAVPRTSKYIELARSAGVPLATEISLFFERCPAPIIGITGSNGKTTTTSLVGAMLAAGGRRSHVGGNIGGSLLGELETIAPDDIVVLELSSFQLEWLDELGMSPRVAVVTNINPNHLDRHGTMQAYAEAKKAVIRHQAPGCTAVLNAEDERLRQWVHSVRGRCLWTSTAGEPNQGAFVRDGWIVARCDGREAAVAPVSALRLPGRHNLLNTLAAVAACTAVGASPEAMAAGIEGFRGIPHRLEFVCRRRGISFYNDSKATTPEAAMAALDSFNEPIVLIAGGSDKHVPLGSLARKIASSTRAAILIGETAPAIAEHLEAMAADGFHYHRAGSLAEAVGAAIREAHPGDVVLLSPACASYDMFPNYEVRGDQFRELVRKV